MCRLICDFRLFGCYEALDGGELAEALEDFTGNIYHCMKIDLQNHCIFMRCIYIHSRYKLLNSTAPMDVCDSHFLCVMKTFKAGRHCYRFETNIRHLQSKHIYLYTWYMWISNRTKINN